MDHEEWRTLLVEWRTLLVEWRTLLVEWMSLVEWRTPLVEWKTLVDHDEWMYHVAWATLGVWSLHSTDFRAPTANLEP